MTVRAWHYMLPGIVLFIFSHCKKKASFSGSIPQVTTAAITNITTSSATAGGMITNNGGATITASGICWSRTSNSPTINDDTTLGTATIGIFSFTLDQLQHDVTYYVRAYAINRAGVGYGQTVSFTTANSAPEVRNISFFGNAAVGELLKLRYTYTDDENNPESGTGFQWYSTNDTVAGTISQIIAATDSMYTPIFSDKNKFVRVNITPRASAGASPGATVSSRWIGPVAEQKADTISFTYNGQPVKYLTITSSVTGRKWLDRNLGAPNTPSGHNDWANYGDLFQWGRAGDGHQLVIRAATTNATAAVNGTTTARSGADIPGHSLFIITTADPFNWRNPGNDNLWQSPARTNNPCPAGWHVPTLDEWFAENLGGLPQAFTQLKITSGGMRNGTDGDFAFTTNDGLYWTSSYNAGNWVATQFNFGSGPGGSAYGQAAMRTVGLSVRCIKD